MASSPHTLELILQAVDHASPVFSAVAGMLGSVVVGALADAARASQETDAAIRGLAVSVDNAGGSWQQDGAAIEAAIGRYKALTGVADSQLRPALANLINETGSVDEGMRRMQTALDLAAGAHITLETASRMVGKVSDENIRVFNKLGLSLADVVNNGMTPAQKEAAVLAAISQRYAGAAEAAKKPTDDWSNALNDLQTNVGGALGPLRDYIALAPGISIAFSGASGALAAFATQLGITRAGMLLTIPIAGGLTIALAPLLAAVAALGLALGAGVVGANLLTGRDAFDFSLGPKATGAADFAESGAVPNAGAPIYDSYGNQVGSVPGYADGGVVSGPMGKPQLAVVHGGETVTPAGRSSGNGGDTFIFNAPVYGLEDFRNQVREAVTQTARGGGFRGIPIG